jgi:hypothetical protein
MDRPPLNLSATSPNRISTTHPPVYCPKCGKPLTKIHNLARRCRSCDLYIETVSKSRWVPCLSPAAITIAATLIVCGIIAVIGYIVFKH